MNILPSSKLRVLSGMLLGLALCSSAAKAQTAALAQAGSSAPSAPDVSSTGEKLTPAAQVQRSIAAMGGDGWVSVGSATAKATVAYADKPSVSLTHSSDWSGHVGLGRSDMSDAKGSRSIVESSRMRYFPDNPKGWQVAPPNFDLSSLAVRYPAAALALALKRNCVLSAPSPKPLARADDQNGIEMECSALSYPNHRAKLFWWFDSAGLVRKVKVPYSSGGGRYLVYETVYFDQYRQIQGLQVPVTIRTVHMGDIVSTQTVTSVSFQASLPATTFQVSPQN